MNRSIVKRYRQINMGEVAMPISIHHTEGNFLVDAEGKRYLDFTSGYGVTNAGWHRREIIEEVQAAMKKLCYSPPWFATSEALDLSEKLLSLAPKELTHCARATGGAEANETIFKAAYALTGKAGILSLSRSYHGGSKFAVNISDAETFRLPRLPLGFEFHKVPAPYCFRCPLGLVYPSCGIACAGLVGDTLQAHPEIGVMYIEAVIGSGGAIVPPPGFLQQVQQICRRHGVLLVLDEVITGFGRLGAMLAADIYQRSPDAISLGKGMGGGIVPIGAALLSTPLADALRQYEDVTATFAWTPLACTAANANISLIQKENLPQHAKTMGSSLLQALQHLFNHYLPRNTGEIRGEGMLIGIDLVESETSRKPALHLMRKLVFSLTRSGLMICASWDFHSLVIMPPLNLSEEEKNLGLELMAIELEKLARTQAFSS